MKHKVRTHHWYDGMLQTVEHFFESVEEALEHAAGSEAHSVKVYTPEGELVHSTVNGTPDEHSKRIENTYA
jgi:hypothetical protein